MNQTICFECRYSVPGLHTPECASLRLEAKEAIKNFVREYVTNHTVSGPLPIVYVSEESYNFETAMQKYLKAIEADYLAWSAPSLTEEETMRGIKERSVQEFNDGLRVIETRLYYKVVSRNSVHSFIVKEDGTTKFKKGDILKAAGYNVPAKNQARGNIFGAYRIRWTGAEYLR